MKYFISISLILGLSLLWTFTSSAAIVAKSTKTTVSSEVKIKTAAQIKSEMKKKKLLEKDALTKKLAELQAKVPVSQAEIDILVVKVNVARMAEPKLYASFMRQLAAARQNHKKLLEEIDATVLSLKKVNQWLKSTY